MTAIPHTSTARVEAVRATTRDAALERDLQIADKLSEWLDSKFSIGGVKFGLDGLIGLVPVAGDVATGILSLYPIYLAGRHNLGGWVIAKMLGNVVVDLLVGLVPFLGDLFDVAFKANRRNFKLFREAVRRRHGLGPIARAERA